MRPSPFRRDPDAAIDVPYKMLISVVLVSMATAILYPVLQTYQETEMERRLALTMAKIESAVVSVHRHAGSSRTLLVDVPSSGGIRLDSIYIGGDLKAPAAEVGTIEWRLSTGSKGIELISSTTGPVPMAGLDGKGLVIERFPCLIVLEARVPPSGGYYRTFVQVSVA